MAKHVVSVSLGSSERDHVAEVELFGEAVTIERRGPTGGQRGHSADQLLDGKVDAFGLGGIDRYIYAGDAGIRCGKETALPAPPNARRSSTAAG